jgi:hypothetical protein
MPNRNEVVGNFEGPVRMHFLSPEGASPQGLGQVRYEVDYSKAALPSKAYFADYCDVRRTRHTSVLLLFGKLDGTGSALRTQVEIVFPQNLFDSQLMTSSKAMLNTFADSSGAVTIEPRPLLGDSEKVQTFAANNVFWAANNEEALMDFYYLSPRGVFLASKKASAEADFEPVIRISTDKDLLQEFFERCKPFAKEATK